MCVEAAATAANSRNHENRLAPLLSEVTPPPSDSDLDETASSCLSHTKPHAQTSHRSSTRKALRQRSRVPVKNAYQIPI